MARRIDLAMGQDHGQVSGSPEPDGFSGLSRSGDLGRMLLSDWALADAEPDEFLRRLVSSEVSYLKRSYRGPRPPAHIAVLFDSTIDQVGAPRLAHLAGLVALERRANALTIPLVIGFVGDHKHGWRSGSLPELFEMWIRSRRSARASQEELDGWIDLADPDSSMWVFGADSLSTEQFGPNCFRLTAVESECGASGVSKLEAHIKHRKVELPLPEPAVGIRVLRGQGLRRRERVNILRGAAALRYPSFHGSVRRLLCRGEGDNQLVTIGIPRSAAEPGGKPKVHNFPGPVLAASLIGNRTVALVHAGGAVQGVVVGKKLANVEAIDLSLFDLDLDLNTVEDLCSNRLEPLYFHGGSIVVRLGERWWSIAPDGTVSNSRIVAAVATKTADQPMFAYKTSAGIQVEGRWPGDSQARVLLGPERHSAIEISAGLWDVGGGEHESVSVDSEAAVFGLTMVDGSPTLVILSKGGHLLRLVGPRGTKTLTKLSNDVATVVVHPTLPILAVQRVDGDIDVVNIETDEMLTRLRSKL